MGYWEERQAKTLAELTEKSVEETEKQLIKYYDTCIHTLNGSFLSTYNHIVNMRAAGKEATPADLYKLDKYWKLQGQIQHELERLGDRTISQLSKSFMEQWREIYEGMALPSDITYSRMDVEAARQMINEIWCADGTSWSQRIWNNTAQLQETLNEGLVDCVITGRSPRQLRERLTYEFDVSWNKADSLVRTEMAHIQTKAAEQRYKDSGVKKVQVWADEDERRCEECGKLHEKIYLIGEKIPIPAHPRCRCCIIPIIDKPQ